MALIKCSECGKQVSDKAGSCPHCGAPIKLGEFYNDEEKNIVVVYCNKIAVLILSLFFIGVGFYISLMVKSFVDYMKIEIGIFFLTPLFIIFILTAILSYSLLKIKIILTNKRVTGNWNFCMRRVDIDYPIRQIKNVSSFGILGISHFRITDGHQYFTVPFAVNGKQFKKEYFNLIENKYKY